MSHLLTSVSALVLGQDFITTPVHIAERVTHLCAEGDGTKWDTVLVLVWQSQAEREEGRPKKGQSRTQRTKRFCPWGSWAGFLEEEVVELGWEKR